MAAIYRGCVVMRVTDRGYNKCGHKRHIYICDNKLNYGIHMYKKTARLGNCRILQKNSENVGSIYSNGIGIWRDYGAYI